MERVKRGDTVKVCFTARLSDGKTVGSRGEDDPLEFEVGQGKVMEAFEKTVIGMRPGQTKPALVPAADAFGPRRADLLYVTNRADLPAGLEPTIGQWLQVRKKNGESTQAKVIAVSEASITLDANHPLAGQDITYDIVLLEIS